MKIELQRTIKYYYLRFIRLRGEPSVLARGVAIGAFIGITPTIPFHTVLALFLALVLRGSKLAALLTSIVISNPLTFFLKYYLSWQVGNWFTTKKHSWGEVATLMNSIVSGSNYGETLTALGHIGINTLIILIGGGIILALPIAIAFYFLSYRLFCSIQKKRQAKRMLI